MQCLTIQHRSLLNQSPFKPAIGTERAGPGCSHPPAVTVSYIEENHLGKLWLNFLFLLANNHKLASEKLKILNF